MSSSDGFDRMHVAPGLFELGQSHFYRYGARAEVKLSTTPSLFHMTFPTPLRTRGCPNIYTIYDIVPLRLPQTTLDNKKQFLRLVRHLCRKADHIVTVSEFSRQDIIRFVGSRKTGSPTPRNPSICRPPSRRKAMMRSPMRCRTRSASISEATTCSMAPLSRKRTFPV